MFEMSKCTIQHSEVEVVIYAKPKSNPAFGRAAQTIASK